MDYLHFDFTLLARLIANGALTPTLDEITVTGAAGQLEAVGESSTIGYGYVGLCVVWSAYGGGGGMAQSVRVFVWIFERFFDAWGGLRQTKCCVEVKERIETDQGAIGVPFRETDGRIGCDSRHR